MLAQMKSQVTVNHNLTMAEIAWNLNLIIRDHKLKFKMYIMCGSLSQNKLSKSNLNLKIIIFVTY